MEDVSYALKMGVTVTRVVVELLFQVIKHISTGLNVSWYYSGI